MRKAKNIKVGDVIEFPYTCWAPNRRGWNGWLFRAGIVTKLYTSTSGIKCAKVIYCESIASRYTMFPNVEKVARLKVEDLYEYNIEKARSDYLECIECERNGEKICWDVDTALLVNHGIFKEEA